MSYKMAMDILKRKRERNEMNEKQYYVKWGVWVSAADEYDAAFQAAGIMNDAIANPVEGASVLLIEDDEGNLICGIDEFGSGERIGK